MSILLQKHQCPGPVNERQVRPLRGLKADDRRVLAWQRACAQKQGTLPTAADVQQVNRLADRKRNQDTDESFRAFRKALESSRSEYTKAHQLLDEGDLEAFLACEDDRSRWSYRARHCKGRAQSVDR